MSYFQENMTVLMKGLKMYQVEIEMHFVFASYEHLQHANIQLNW